MSETLPIVKAAVVQAAPVLFDRDATLEKTCRLIRQGAARGARLILFPEAFIPAYPRGLTFGTAVGSRSLDGRRTWEVYWTNAVDVPGPVTTALGAAARDACAYLAIGVIERDQGGSRGTLYCTLLYFGPDGRLLGKHRKLKPTADARDTWQATLRHIACEGRCFVLGCNQFVTKSMYPAHLPGIEELASQPEIMCRGGSAIVGPLGGLLAGPLYDQEGTLFADLDLGEIPRSRFDFDVVGHYARPDVFHLTVNQNPSVPVTYASDAETQDAPRP